MKKFMIAISVILGSFCVKAYAVGPQWGVPEGDSAQIIQTADYGGVLYATSAFSSAVSTTTFSTTTVSGRSVVYGALFSTGNCGSGDYVDVFDATTTLVIPRDGGGNFQPTARFYNVFGSTGSTVLGGTNNNAACSGFSGPPKPIRITKGLLWKPSSANYNMINLLYWKEEK